VCRNIFKKWSVERITAYAALIVAIVSFIGLFITVHYANDTQRLANEGQLNQIMVVYLAKYDDCIKGPCKAGFHSVDEFRGLKDTDQTTVTIVAGLLILLVDAMYKADDPRADKWKSYFARIPGPLVGYPEIESYAADQRTIKAIHLVIAANK
jgi:hypothetical protein